MDGVKNKLRKLSKEDLLFIISRVAARGGWSSVEYALSDLETRKLEQKYDKADEINEKAMNLREEYFQMLSPYNGMKVQDIPFEILEKASALAKEAEKLDKQWNRMMWI